MDQAYLHMLSNHVPIIGTMFALLVLVAGIIKQNSSIKIVGYLLIVLSVIGGLVAFYTGEAAEELVEGLQGVSENVMHDHEEAGELAMVFLYATGIAALLALFLENRKKYQKAASFIVLLLGLGLFGTAARAGYYGGQIRHTELHQVPAGVDAGATEEAHEQEYEDED